MDYPSFLDFLRDRIGRNWVIARRTTRIICRYGSDVVCLTNKRYSELEHEWISRHPAMLLALSLPAGPEKDLICRALRYELK